MSVYSEHQKNTEQGEISLVGILLFLKGASRILVVTGVIGLALSIVYLGIVPKQYEAVAQIQVAQIIVGNNNLNLTTTNVEEPPFVIARFSQPTSFTQQVLVACRVDGDTNPGGILAKSIKMTSPKGLPNLIELRTYAASPHDAQSCAQAIFELIKSTQALIVAPYIDSAKTRLAGDEERLLKVKDLLVKADKSRSAVGATYLATRDEIRSLLDEIAILNNIISSNQIGVTRLLSPIYANDTPIAPKNRLVLLVGLLNGLLFGLLLAFVRQMTANLKNDMGGGSW
ncbi:Wzz/FepE/Etk N-terminal domain-containing protein [Polynucleobacter sp. MWH-Braz-FAM2G]|uniref:Wzz/FepE/Etk N-terminal domain-containing protein n=1 Tax=Polynucleobacter sp. MWH-Braz-FAM2G TaxID=1855883 RepID=UPI001BFD50E9|nr:Wzz/FepE/Etk N-terminal domain-containing protein [Polynucleobacter sp. MWH-Braz-FAM2G]QWD91081.1 hypothetical protein FD973_01705 [Polynucleobacter sp. MWH-Braz-FAM2G]